jgi:hypothetical protein
VANYWVGIVAWSDGSERNIDVVGLFSTSGTAFAAVQDHLIHETGFVVGMEDAGQRRGTVKDSNVTWDWAVEPVDGIQP